MAKSGVKTVGDDFKSTGLNGHLVCSIDVETTGRDPSKHDIIQVCILPLDDGFRPNKRFVPFYMPIQPRDLSRVDMEAMSINRLKLGELLTNAVPYDAAADLFITWFEKLKLPENRRILPLGHNYPFDRAFLIEWLGPLCYDYYIDARYRDTMPASLYSCDRCNMNNEEVRYPKCNLAYLANVLKIDTTQAHDALNDAITTAAVYRAMLTAFQP